MLRPARTISVGTWDSTARDNPVKLGSINDTVYEALAEVLLGGLGNIGIDSSWLPTGPLICGAMWAGVPTMENYWRDEEGGWMITTYSSRNRLLRSHLRLCPAQAGAEVQYGFCPLRLDNSEELLIEKLGPREGWKIKRLEVQPQFSATFRMDRIFLAALHLGDPGNVSEEAQRFRHLLGPTSLGTVMKDVARGCYKDTSVDRDVLGDRDENYRDALQLVCCQAYPDCLSMPITLAGPKQAAHLMGLDQHEWGCPDYLYPYVYNVVMPPDIFSLVSDNLERGIPAIVPQYVMERSWMFNGSWRDPCTGLEYASGIAESPAGRKLLAGVINRFNLDLPGRVSYWLPSNDPPEGWVAKFADCLRKLGEQAMPLSIEERANLALTIGRQIPVMLNLGDGSRKFARVLDYTTEDNYLGTLTIRECSEGGEVIESADPSVATPEETSQSEDSQDNSGEESIHCGLCEGNYPPDGMVSCSHCEEPTCGSCTVCCDTCKKDYCQACMDEHGCVDCAYCGVRRASTTRCVECNRLICTECSTHHPECRDAYVGRICLGCTDNHICEGM